MNSNRTIAITGVSSGIGAATARACASLGFHLMLGARRVDRLEAIASSLRTQFGVKVEMHALDVQDGASVRSFFDKTRENFGGIDALVNNAGLGLGRDAIAAARLEDWQTMYDTNVLGVLRVTQAFLPGLIERKGHVVNVGSIAGREVYEGGAGYGGTKFALRAFTKTLRQELFGKGVRVTSIDPGMVETEFSEVRFGGDKEMAKAVYQGMTPLVAEDVARAIAFVLSQPPHVNIDEILITPTDQVSATRVFRKND